MVLQVKRKMKIYRRFEKDIWGLARTNLSADSKYLQFLQKLFLFKQLRRRQGVGTFVYDQVMIFKRKDKKRMKKRFVSLRLVKLYYVILSYKQLRKLGTFAARADGFFQNNFCYFLEGRLCTIIYRTNFVRTLFEALDLIRYSKVWVNKALISAPNYRLRIGDILTFRVSQADFFRSFLLLRFKRKGVFFSTPRFLFVSYKLFVASLLLYPQDRDLAFPLKFDLYRITGYY